MIHKTKRLHFVVGFFIAILFSFPINAATLTIDSVYFGYGSTASYDQDPNKDEGGISVSFNGGAGPETFAGMLQVDYEGSDTWGFCVDLGTPLNLAKTGGSTYQYTTVDPISYNENLIYVEWLLDEFAGEAFSNQYRQDGAALQLAIWEVMYDLDNSVPGDYSLDYDSGTGYGGTGNFFYDRDEIAIQDPYWVNKLYDDYITALVSEISSGDLNSSYQSSGNYIIAELSNAQGDSQDIIVNVVPEPSTAVLFGLGLLTLGAVGRRKV